MPHITSRKHLRHSLQNRLWKAGYAWSAFKSVVETCDSFLDQRIQPDTEIYYPLTTAISVLYARPLKHSRGIEKLTVQFVPKKFSLLHCPAQMQRMRCRWPLTGASLSIAPEPRLLEWLQFLKKNLHSQIFRPGS